MKNININSAAISAIIVWAIRIIESVAFSIVSEMANSNIPKKWILSLILILLTLIGAHIYYRKEYRTNGFIFGIGMLIINLILDAILSVPLFLQNYLVSYSSFFFQ